jgi:hypothetical protein
MYVVDVCALAERHNDKAASNVNAVKFIFFMCRYYLFFIGTWYRYS